MTQEEMEARRREMEAEIAANEAADQEYRRKLKRNIILGAIIIIVAIVSYLVLKPNNEPDVYYKMVTSTTWPRPTSCAAAVSSRRLVSSEVAMPS